MKLNCTSSTYLMFCNTPLQQWIFKGEQNSNHLLIDCGSSSNNTWFALTALICIHIVPQMVGRTNQIKCHAIQTSITSSSPIHAKDMHANFHGHIPISMVTFSVAFLQDPWKLTQGCNAFHCEETEQLSLTVASSCPNRFGCILGWMTFAGNLEELFFFATLSNCLKSK